MTKKRFLTSFSLDIDLSSPIFSIIIGINLINNYLFSVVLKICDELDRAKDLHDYFKAKLQKHISSNIMPEL